MSSKKTSTLEASKPSKMREEEIIEEYSSSDEKKKSKKKTKESSEESEEEKKTKETIEKSFNYPYDSQKKEYITIVPNYTDKTFAIITSEKIGKDFGTIFRGKDEGQLSGCYRPKIEVNGKTYKAHTFSKRRYESAMKVVDDIISGKVIPRGRGVKIANIIDTLKKELEDSIEKKTECKTEIIQTKEDGTQIKIGWGNFEMLRSSLQDIDCDQLVTCQFGSKGIILYSGQAGKI